MLVVVMEISIGWTGLLVAVEVVDTGWTSVLVTVEIRQSNFVVGPGPVGVT